MGLEQVIWKEYHLYDLFEINSGNKFDKSKMTTFEPRINFIGRSSTRNGVTAYVDYIEGIEPYEAGCMTIALGGEHLGSCFIQLRPFYTSQNVVVLTPKLDMTDNVKVFIAHVIRYESKNNYMAFARELNAHIRTDFLIKLPCTEDNELDVIFMNDYIESLKSDFTSIPDYFMDEGYDKAFWYLDNVDQELFEKKYANPCLCDKKINLNSCEWDFFRLGDIISDIHNGKAYNVSDLTVSNGNNYIAYVTRTGVNNGISLYAENKDYAGKEQANAITIGDTTATIFYQAEDFITGPHIIVMRAPWFNVYTASFIITLLNKEMYRYPVFGRSFSKTLIQNTILYLPIDHEGKPNYEFMERYIKNCSFSCNIE